MSICSPSLGPRSSIPRSSGIMEVPMLCTGNLVLWEWMLWNINVSHLDVFCSFFFSLVSLPFTFQGTCENSCRSGWQYVLPCDAGVPSCPAKSEHRMWVGRQGGRATWRRVREGRGSHSGKTGKGDRKRRRWGEPNIERALTARQSK